MFSGIPARTKLIFIGAVIGLAVAIPGMLFFVPKNNEANLTHPAAESGEQVEDREPAATQPAVEVASPETEEPAPKTPSAETIISGTIVEDTTWSPADSDEYVINNAVLVPDGVTLTIEAGTVIRAEDATDMFILDGTIIAHGTPENPIVFDGGGNSSFFTRRNSNTDAFLDLDYATIKNGIRFWRSIGDGQFGSFSLQNVHLMNISGGSELWYPDGDVRIENCVFENTGGFSIVQRHGTKVYIRNNTFKGKNPALPAEEANYWIRSRGSFNEAETIIKYNTFSPEDGIAVKLDEGEDAEAVIATENYWGTDDEDIIEMMIWDGNDDPGVEGQVEYSPFLTSPPQTPKP